MATWQSQYSVLTDVGKEILNKIKAGQGFITVSRIVAGSGRVPVENEDYKDDLPKQTKVSGTQKDFILTGINTEEDSSEISFEITNKGFTAPYTINQIGVYVTHPDYQGEQLYHISQCDEGGDEIPIYESNVVTMGYSLVLFHSNSPGALSVTVDPNGTVKREEFDTYKSEAETRYTAVGKSISDLSDSLNTFKTEAEKKHTSISNSVTSLNNTFNTFKSGIKQNKLITSDSNGNLIASGKTTVRGTSFSITDAITHRALSLSIEGKSTQGTPTVATPVYLVNTKVNYVRNASGSTSKLINFPSGIVLRSVGDYEDTIEWDGAKWWKVQRIQEVVLDGTTNGVYYDGYNSSTYCRLAITSGTIYKQIKDHITTAPILTSHGNTVGDTSELYAFHYSSNGGICGHFLNSITGVDPNVQKTLQEKCAVVNTWLTAQKNAGKPVTVWYVLKTPVVTEISLTEVLEMYASSTSITCNADNGTPNMQLSYALNTTDDTTMYILKSLARKTEVTTANTFAEATLGA